MKEKEFRYYFPHADNKYFKGKEIDINWDNTNEVKKLGLSTSDFMTYTMSSPSDFFQTYKNLHRLKYIEKNIWKPEEWSYNPNSSPEIIKLTKNDINLTSFRIYANEKDFFVHNDSFLDFSSIDEIDFNDEKNDYCVVLKAMYILSYLGGISLKNLKSENSLATSLTHFYFYYHLKKFLNYRNFSSFNTKPVEDLDWSLYNWRNHFVWYHSQITYSPSSLKRTKHDVIRNIRHLGKKVYWQSRVGKRDISKDYLSLIKNNGSGLTKIGQILFQESSQAFVYCILGAQAKTRWKIIGDGANSYQTQVVFSSLVEEITSQDNLSILIKSMRLAISTTKVRLDFVISPGLDVLPSNLLYIKDSPGYNNILLISNKSMKFGVNNVNSLVKVSSPPSSPQPQRKEKQNPIKNAPEHSNAPVLISAGLIALLARYVWVFAL